MDFVTIERITERGLRKFKFLTDKKNSKFPLNFVDGRGFMNLPESQYLSRFYALLKRSYESPGCSYRMRNAECLLIKKTDIIYFAVCSLWYGMSVVCDMTSFQAHSTKASLPSGEISKIRRKSFSPQKTFATRTPGTQSSVFSSRGVAAIN